MQNYISNIKIIKDGVVTTLDNPTTNGRFKIVNGKIVMKEAIPLTKVSDNQYTAEIDGEYIIYGIIRISGYGYLTISLNDDQLFNHYFYSNSYTIILPVKGTGTLTIKYDKTIVSIDQLKLWTFL